MRRRSLSLALVTLLVSLPAGPVAGQAPGFAIPHEPVVVYLNSIVAPAIKAQAPSEATLKTYYETRLAAYSRAQVREEQFIAYWQASARRTLGQRIVGSLFIGFPTNVEWTLRDPVYNEAQDQAQVIVQLRWFRGTVQQGSASTTYLVVKEQDSWRLVLPDDQAAGMQRLPSTVVAGPVQSGPAGLARRFTADRKAADAGITLRVGEVALDGQAATVQVVLENANAQDADLKYALPFTSLSDDKGKPFDLRLAQTEIVGTIPAKGSIAGTLVFRPVPAGTQRLTLDMPDVRVGGRSISLRVDMLLTP